MSTARVDFNHITTERDLTSVFLELCTMHGWTRRYHTYRSKKSHTGFPDWVIVHPLGGTVFVELKGARTKVLQDQLDWCNDLRQSLTEAYIWRPRDGQPMWNRLSNPYEARRWERLPQLAPGDVAP